MTALLIILAIAAVVAVLVKLDRIDTRRCAIVNRGIVSLALASRAKTLADCPEEFLARVRAALPAPDGDEVPR
jgi:hypothetical protein